MSNKDPGGIKPLGVFSLSFFSSSWKVNRRGVVLDMLLLIAVIPECFCRGSVNHCLAHRVAARKAVLEERDIIKRVWANNRRLAHRVAARRATNPFPSV